MFWLTRVQSHSMTPALRDGALALTRRLGRRTPVRRGDVVVVDSHELGRHVVKRVIGLPGETVAIEAGRVSINGQPLAEPYVKFPCDWNQNPVPVGPDQYYLVGDNRDNPREGHEQGRAARALIIGKVLL